MHSQLVFPTEPCWLLRTIVMRIVVSFTEDCGKNFRIQRTRRVHYKSVTSGCVPLIWVNGKKILIYDFQTTQDSQLTLITSPPLRVNTCLFSFSDECLGFASLTAQNQGPHCIYFS